MSLLRGPTQSLPLRCEPNPESHEKPRSSERAKRLIRGICPEGKKDLSSLASQAKPNKALEEGILTKASKKGSKVRQRHVSPKILCFSSPSQPSQPNGQNPSQASRHHIKIRSCLLSFQRKQPNKPPKNQDLKDAKKQN